MQKFLNKYFNDVKLLIDNNDINTLIKISKIFKECSKKGKKIIFCGNGGSAATSSHVAVDFTKNAKIRSINFNESDLITCLSNDYGYENWLSSAINLYADKGDVLVIISVSGESRNLVNALKYAIKKNIKTICFTGVNKNNKLNKLNKNSTNIFVDSKSYNQVEIIHHIYLLSLVDLCIGKTIYSPQG
tara:strand:+ start:1116 stop:1679 length:564 start_codon:yes stop_codon:yes gene_type:complete